MLVSKRNTWMSFGCLAVAMILVVILAVDLFLFRYVAAEGKASVPPLPEKLKAEFCLGCHGPFEKLAKRTAAYVTDQGEKVNPHVYVPHHSNKITGCNECHDVHPLPVTSPSNIAKANVQYCYSACHHENDFTPCVQCHKDKK